MKRKLNLVWCILTMIFVFFSQGYAQTTKMFTVKADQTTAKIQPAMWGIFFEDINLGADGGVYAELVKNRSFEFNAPLMGWKEQKQAGGDGSILVHNQGDNNPNPRFIRVALKSAQGNYGLSNEGFRGMGIKKGNQYDFSVMARQNAGSNLTLNIELLSASGARLGSTVVAPAGQEWKKYNVSFTAAETDAKAQLYIWVKGQGTIDLDMISLFPKDTWKQRPGGMRADVVQLLADLKPGFLRFPGGCIVEGRELDTRYQWKKTIGNIEDREMIVNRWNTEFAHRPTPDYFQTFGLGFYEYFQLSEDIGAEPLPILNCGMACQFNSAEVVPVNELGPYIQDVLDLIEFANGPADSQWGKVRAQMGHPAPFNMKMMGVGNEQWGEQYVERYKIFEKAIKAKYPDIKLITSVGPFPDGPEFDYLNKEMRNLKVDIIDEHYYKSPDWFLQNARRYDNYDRNGPKIFAGEYAVQTVAVVSPENKNNWQGAMSEAAFMTGLERNADVVHLASYAPLFAHTEGWQWTPNLIWMDNLKSFGTPNYYVQRLFSNNKGTDVIPILLAGQTATGQDGLYASAVIDKKTNELILKVVNTSDMLQTGEFSISGVKKLQATGSITTLTSDRLTQENSIANPMSISPVEKAIEVKGTKVQVPLKAYSVNIIKVKIS